MQTSETPSRQSGLCFVCGQPVQDWQPRCPRCVQELRPVQAAVRSELAHIAYLFAQFPDWQERALLTPNAEAQLRKEYTDREGSLRRVLEQQTAVVSAMPPPIVPGLPGVLPNKTVPPPPPNGLRLFFQNHALKIIFALATVLTLVALRSMLQWSWMDAVAVLLLPLVPLGLTLLFGWFGQRTRAENPWAAFVYHGLAATLLAFDVLAVNRYWLGGLLPLKPALFGAFGAATAGYAVLFLRWKERPYLHLLLSGLTLSLYTALQCVRLTAPESDFAPEPVLLFGSVFLVFAAGTLFCAAQSPHTSDLLSPAPRRTDWLLWTNLLILASPLMALLGPSTSGMEFALFALTAGVLYAVAAQSLALPGLVYMAGLFALAGGLQTLSVVSNFEEANIALLFLAVAAIALTFAPFNRDEAEALKIAWYRLAVCCVVTASALIWGVLALNAFGIMDARDGAQNTLVALLCAGFFGLLALHRRDSRWLYGTLAGGAFTLLGGMEALDYPLPLRPVLFFAYGATLCLLAYRLVLKSEIQNTSETRLPSLEIPLAISGQLLLFLGAGWEMLFALRGLADPAWEFFASFRANGYATPFWTILTLCWAGVYLYVGAKLRKSGLAALSVPALFCGSVIMLCGRAVFLQAHPVPALLTDVLVILSGGLLTFGYLKTALWSEKCEFSVLAALTLTGAYVWLLAFPISLSPVWYGLLFLPFLTVLYLFGLRRTEQETLVNKPIRETALVLSLLALGATVGYGDFLANRAPALVTLTFAAYTFAYAVLTFFRRTPNTFTLAASVGTLTYLHHLLTLTSALSSQPTLSYPYFAFLASQAGVFWLGIGYGLHRIGKEEFAPGILHLAGTTALLTAIIALWNVQTPGAGHWSILTLAWAGAVWFGLWRLEMGEICLHVAGGNLFLAWSLVLYDNVGADAKMLDLYLLPVGIYLLVIGHLFCGRQQLARARTLWWAGILLLLTPAYLAFIDDAGPLHTVLLVCEMLGAILWGIGTRIRAFVCGGLLFAGLFAAANVVGHLPDLWGTFATLLIGVALFVAGFYALTHRERLQEWAAAFDARWQAWLAWR